MMAAQPTGLALPHPTGTAAFDDATGTATRRSGAPLAAPSMLLIAMLSIAWFALRPLVDEQLHLPLGMVAIVLPALVACWLSIGVSRRRDLPRRDVIGWTFVALACGTASISAMVVLIPGGSDASGAIPLIGAAAHTLMLVFGSVGVLHWVRRLSPATTVGTMLDLLCVGVVAYVVSWRTLVSDAILGTTDAEGRIDEVMMLTTPAFGTLLLVAVVMVLSQVGREDIRGTELLATFGLGAMVATELAMSMRGVKAGGLDDAWQQAIVGSDSLPVVTLGWMLGIAAIGFGAALRRTAPVHGSHLPLIERSTSWELLVSLIPFAMLAVVFATTSTTRAGNGMVSTGLLAILGGLLLTRCTLVAVNAIRTSRTRETDRLTHAYSHRMFQERLPTELARARAAREPLALVVLDVDDFGTINETLSHAEGDRFLQELSWVLRRELQGGELLFRNGGDEFAILVPACDKQRAVDLAEQLMHAIGEMRTSSGVRPSLTIGVAAAPEDASDAGELLHLASGTLYWGKLNGKATITAYDPDVVRVLSDDERLEAMERTARLRAVFALARALDARDAYTARHSENVSRYSVAIARQLGWSAERIELLRVAGLLHDVGKIGVRDSTLRKSARLTAAEWEEMQEHPLLGARMVTGVAPEEIVPWIVSHHERIDGNGYPHQLVGDAIPDGARILAVADTFDAMTSSRSYRPALSPIRALEELVNGVGVQFDPECVRAFVQAIRAGAIDLQDVARAAQSSPAQEQHVDSSEPVTVDPEFAAPTHLHDDGHDDEQQLRAA